jgi:cation diffusion facilitator family transporter
MAHLKKYGQSAALLIGISFLLLSLKLIAWFLTGSIALLSEALDSFIGLIAIIGSYTGIIFLAKKPDDKFNYNFSKAQNAASFFISILIIIFAGAVGKMGYNSFFIHTAIKNSAFAYIAGIFSIAVSAFLSFYLIKKSNELNSELFFIASKERLADAFRGVIVIASILLDEIGMPYVSGIAAITICMGIFFIGIKSLALSIKGLLSKSIGKKIMPGILEIIKKNNDISDFKNLRLKKSGNYIFGDAEIRFDKKYSIMQAHEIADKIERQIMNEYEEIASFIINVKPNE